jgi:Protein of unknown function (DUF3551)
MRIMLFVLGIVFGIAALATNAEAQNYPWCAVYGGGRGGGGENCGFTTFEQCLETVRGIGGYCERNNTYVPPPGPHARRYWRYRHRYYR